MLVRAAFDGDRGSVRRAASAIAVAILHGARDRSREPPLRTLHDQQRRTCSLTKPRVSRHGRSSQALIATAAKASAIAAEKAIAMPHVLPGVANVAA